MEYTVQQSVSRDFDQVVERTVDVFEDGGFGVFYDTDVRSAFGEKLGEEARQCRILGACTPALAHKGQSGECDLGALLSCNAIVYETDDSDVIMSAVDPQQLVGIADNDALDPIAIDVHGRFERELSAVGNGTQYYMSADQTSDGLLRAVLLVLSPLLMVLLAMPIWVEAERRDGRRPLSTVGHRGGGSGYLLYRGLTGHSGLLGRGESPDVA